MLVFAGLLGGLGLGFALFRTVGRARSRATPSTPPRHFAPPLGPPNRANGLFDNLGVTGGSAHVQTYAESPALLPRAHYAKAKTPPSKSPRAPRGDVLDLGPWRLPDAINELGSEERLVIVYDAYGLEDDPSVSLRPNQTGRTEVVLNGRVIATMPAEKTPAIEDIVVMSEKTAAAWKLR